MKLNKQAALRTVAVKLKQFREKSGYSLTGMATHLGMTASGYNKNEHGENFPGIVTLQRLSELDGVSMDWLLFDKGPMYFQAKGGREEVLEQEVSALKRELEVVRERASALDNMPDVKALVDTMKRVPMLYHEILLHFQKFKVENKDLLDSPPVPSPPAPKV